MRKTLILAAFLLAHAAQAAPQSTAVRDVVKDPKPLVGREIRLTGLRCASEPGGRYACGTSRRGKPLRIESLGLDFRTSADMRKTLSSRCRASLERVDTSCRFDVELRVIGFRIDPPDARAKAGVVRLSARRMNLFAPGSRR